MENQGASQTPAQPSLSDDVAITALVISLFALVVGLSQFLQAILGTAEGYRRCGASVIGPWSKLRRRVFQWSEFRYETRYMVPSIALVPLLDLAVSDLVRALEPAGLASQSRSQRLRPGEYGGHVCDLARISPGYGPTSPSLWSKANSLFLRFFPSRANPTDVILETLRLPELLQKDVYVKSKIDAAGGDWRTSVEYPRARSGMPQSDNEVELGITSAMQGGKTRDETPRFPDTFTVTWIRLIRELHVLYQSYIADKCDECCDAASAKDEPVSERNGSTVVVRPIIETWDFMPQDVSRPMASSTVGHMTVLALRLGMQWRLLDRARLQMNADGNGFNISSTEIKGLGMAFRLSVFARAHYHHPIAPSEAADKMMCGIVPGDPTLVMADFGLVGHDRALIQLWQPGSVYTKLGLDDGNIGLIRERNRWTTHNEVVTVLCSWIPAVSSHNNAFFFSGWKTRQYSVFHFFESRLAFLMRSGPSLKPAMRYVQESLATLARDYPYEFYDGWTSRESKEQDQQKRVVELTSVCLRIFKSTTQHFKDYGYADDNGSDKTWYMQLVAARARLSARVNWRLDPSTNSSQSEILKRHDRLLRDAGVETTYFAEHLWDQTLLYIGGVGDEKYGIHQYMSERGFKAKKEDVIDAWWMLMLRGIVWDMSCKCLPFPGEPVPSSYYNDETTVWIT